MRFHSQKTTLGEIFGISLFPFSLFSPSSHPSQSPPFSLSHEFPSSLALVGNKIPILPEKRDGNSMETPGKTCQAQPHLGHSRGRFQRYRQIHDGRNSSIQHPLEFQHFMEETGTGAGRRQQSLGRKFQDFSRYLMGIKSWNCLRFN